MFCAILFSVSPVKNWRRSRLLLSPSASRTPLLQSAYRHFYGKGVHPKAVLGLFPSDHVILDEKHFREDISRAADSAAQGANIVVIGIKPTRAETGYGYIEAGSQAQTGLLRVKRFTEKPNAEVADQFIKAGNFFWNSGMFIWGRFNLGRCIDRASAEDCAAPLLREIAASYGTRNHDANLCQTIPKM